ncbi:sorting nexin-16 [Drosophila kikkawai]|uniref:Sorting nexin-16 n=1 Tax=Drosophila kikkawai TaxID=30033 RepID=A0A6P4I7Q2_DROKI|nr:sorting nexin-16 [Drosophila kikkawai]
MSLRALRKSHNNNTGTARTPQTPSSSSSSLFKKASTATSTSPKKKSLAQTLGSNSATRSVGKQTLFRQRQLLGRCCHSSPDLRQGEKYRNSSLLRSKSEGDVGLALLERNSGATLTAANAKSEVCLQRISSHSYEHTRSPNSNSSAMLGGARSHRDLTQSSYGHHAGGNHGDSLEVSTRAPRRMSECSLGYSQTSSRLTGGNSHSMFASQMTLSSGSQAPPVDPNAVLRVPIIGYEVMEERARFTVYKLRVENPETNDCWLVMRRYTDFVRLNGKLKQSFPKLSLMLPRKKLFGDNFNAVFLDNRVQGLQIFVNSVMAKEELRKCKLVREFFCLDEPPSYSESMEECRAIFEAQEETIAHLKLQIQNKNDLILSLQQKLRDEMNEKEQLREAMKNVDLNCSHCSSANEVEALGLK